MLPLSIAALTATGSSSSRKPYIDTRQKRNVKLISDHGAERIENDEEHGTGRSLPDWDKFREWEAKNANNDEFQRDEVVGTPEDFLKPKLNQTYPFNCTSPLKDRGSDSVPTDVSQLRPKDVKYVMAMGDSITAGFGAYGYPVEYRGVAWSDGTGSAQEPTLPFYLRHFNPNVTGASSGTILPETPAFRTYFAPLSLVDNVALTSSLVEDVKNLQIPYLARRNISEDDWKVLTIFIGANNICSGKRACTTTDTAQDLADEYELNLTKVLELIMDNYKNIYINLTQFFYLSGVARTGKAFRWCGISHYFYEECDCLQKERDVAVWNKTDIAVDKVNDAIERVARKFHRYNGRSDVGVHLFSTLKGKIINDIDMLSSLDCFHPSAATHHWMANSLWNSMFGIPSELPEKKNGNFIFKPPNCPDPSTPFKSGPETFGEDLLLHSLNSSEFKPEEIFTVEYV